MASVSESDLILNISQNYAIVINTIILMFGIVGHIFNIFVMTRIKSFRGNPSAFCLITESIANLLQLVTILPARIALYGYEIDLAQTSIIWCKLKPFLLECLTLVSLSIVCFAAIDQYLSTNYDPYLREKSTVKLAKTFTITAVILWVLHGLPALFIYEIGAAYGCGIYNYAILIYIMYIYCFILSGMLPMCVSTIFSLLAYKNVRRIIRTQMSIRRRKLDQQLTAMILTRVAFLVVMILPYDIGCIFLFRAFGKNQNITNQANLQLIACIVISFNHFNYAVC